MNRALAGLILLLLLPLALVSCRSTGREVAGGAFDEARAWWASEGKGLAEDAAEKVTDKAVETAQAKLREKYDKEIAEAKKAAEAGTATWWQLLLLAAAGYPVGREVRKRVFGNGKPGPSA